MIARGFSLIEILVVVSIVALLAVGSVVALSGGQRDRQLNAAADGLLFTLEAAKSEALSGRFGEPHGVHFATSSYAQFVGGTFNANDTRTQQVALPKGFTISIGLDGGVSDVVFARVTGKATGYGSITIADNTNASRSRTIQIGAQGGISKQE